MQTLNTREKRDTHNNRVKRQQKALIENTPHRSSAKGESDRLRGLEGRMDCGVGSGDSEGEEACAGGVGGKLLKRQTNERKSREKKPLDIRHFAINKMCLGLREYCK